MADPPRIIPPPPPYVPGPGPVTWDGPVVVRVERDELAGLRMLSTVVMLLVAGVALLNLVSIPNDIAYIGSLRDLMAGDVAGAADVIDQEDLRVTLGRFALGGYVIAGIAWIVWQQRARSLAERLGAGGQRHTKVLAGFGWVVPFANLVIPKQVTDDLWRASDPDAPPAGNIEGRPVWWAINAWWLLWIIGAVLGRILLQGDSPETIAELDGYISNVRLQVGATLLAVVSAVPAVLIVRQITTRLTTRARRFGIEG